MFKHGFPSSDGAHSKGKKSNDPRGNWKFASFATTEYGCLLEMSDDGMILTWNPS